MEITPETLSQKLDSAGILYHRARIDHGQQIKILDGNGKIPDALTITIYTTGSVVIQSSEVKKLRDLLHRIS